MPLPVSAKSFLPNPLVSIDAERAGFDIGQRSNNFANFVSGAFQGASTTAGIIEQVQRIEGRPREEARRDRQLKLEEQRFELSKEREARQGVQDDRNFELNTERIELERERINLRRRDLAIQASEAAVKNRTIAREVGVENSIVQLENGNPDSLIAEYSENPGQAGKLLLDNSKGSKGRRARAQSAISSYLQSDNGTEDQRQRLAQISENLEDQRYLIDNAEKTSAAFSALSSNHIPAEADQLVLVTREKRNGVGLEPKDQFQDVVRVFDQDGKQTYSISEDTLRRRGLSDDRIETVLGASQRIQEYQRRQQKAIEKPLAQLAEARAKQQGQPVQQEQPVKTQRARQQLQGTGLAPAATPAQARARESEESSNERAKRLREIERKEGSIRSPQSKTGESQLRELAGL